MIYDKEMYIYNIPVLDNITDDGHYKIGLNYYPVYIHTTMGDSIPANKELIIENNVRVVYFIKYDESEIVYVPVRTVLFNKEFFSKNKFVHRNNPAKVLCQSDIFFNDKDDMIEILCNGVRKKVHVHELERLHNNVFDYCRIQIRKLLRNIFFDKRY